MTPSGTMPEYRPIPTVGVENQTNSCSVSSYALDITLCDKQCIYTNQLQLVAFSFPLIWIHLHIQVNVNDNNLCMVFHFKRGDLFYL